MDEALRKYLECFIFAHGFARAWCDVGAMLNKPMVRLDDFAWRCPRDDCPLRLQKLIAARGLAVVLESLIGCYGWGLLFHRPITLQPLGAWTSIIKSLVR